jgi:hypothetical protein
MAPTDQWLIFSSGALGLRALWDFGNFDTSTTSSYGLSGLCNVSHFKFFEAHLPEGLDRLPPDPFKINDSYSLWGLFLWRYTLHKLALPNACESLIWIVLRIFTVKRLKIPSAYPSILKQTTKKSTLCVHGYDLHDQGFGQLDAS